MWLDVATTPAAWADFPSPQTTQPNHSSHRDGTGALLDLGSHTEPCALGDEEKLVRTRTSQTAHLHNHTFLTLASKSNLQTRHGGPGLRHMLVTGFFLIISGLLYAQAYAFATNIQGEYKISFSGLYAGIVVYFCCYMPGLMLQEEWLQGRLL